VPIYKVLICTIGVLLLFFTAVVSFEAGKKSVPVSAPSHIQVPAQVIPVMPKEAIY